MEWVFWLLGGHGTQLLAALLWATAIFCVILALSDTAKTAVRSSTVTSGVALLSVVLAVVTAVGGGYSWFYTPPDAQEQTYVSEEHQLASVGNLREQESTTSTYSGILTYASTTTVDNVETIRFIRQQQDERGTYYTIEARPMSEVRLYQANDEAPVERHWHTRTVATNPYTGEEHYFNDRLDYVEIKVPEGSVANDYELSLNQ